MIVSPIILPRQLAYHISVITWQAYCTYLPCWCLEQRQFLSWESVCSVSTYCNKQTGAKTWWVNYIVIHYWLHPSYRVVCWGRSESSVNDLSWESNTAGYHLLLMYYQTARCQQHKVAVPGSEPWSLCNSSSPFLALYLVSVYQSIICIASHIRNFTLTPNFPASQTGLCRVRENRQQWSSNCLSQPKKWWQTLATSS